MQRKIEMLAEEYGLNPNDPEEYEFLRALEADPPKKISTARCI
jgi:hypothetical protein